MSCLPVFVVLRTGKGPQNCKRTMMGFTSSMVIGKMDEHGGGVLGSNGDIMGVIMGT